MVTDDALKQIMPNLDMAKRTLYLPYLQKAMVEFGIDTPLRESAFLAQIAHESGELRFLEEIWGPTPAQRHYEPSGHYASQLGNIEPGDGKRFRGRGAIQLCGRKNYQKYGQMLGLDLVNNPEWAADPQAAFRIAALFWHKNGLNEHADKKDFTNITRKINGGLNGLEERIRFYKRALCVLGPNTNGKAIKLFAKADNENSMSELLRGSEVIDEQLRDK